MNRREAMLGMLALGTSKVEGAGPVKCPWPGCRKGFITDGDLLVFWQIKGKPVQVHGFHIIEKHMPHLAKK